MKRYSSADEFIAAHPQQQQSLQLLRSLFLETELEETIKWGIPVYTINNKNVAGLGAFKAYVGIWFFQGVFLKDPEGLLINAQEGKTKGLRQIRFQSILDIQPAILRTYIQEAIANQKKGLEVEHARSRKDIQIPDELQLALDQAPTIQKAFNDLTPGRRKEYAEYIREAKQAATKTRRLEKILPMIASGAGLNDRYK